MENRKKKLRFTEQHFAFGKNLEEIMLEKNISQGLLCLRTGMNKKNLSNIINGKTNPRLDTMILILSGLGDVHLLISDNNIIREII